MDKKPDDKVMVTVEMPRPLVKKLDSEAKEQDRPRSWIIRKLLTEGLEKTA